MSNTIKELSFVSLLNQYSPGCQLIETKNGIEFKKYTNIFQKFFDHLHPSNHFDIEQCAPILTKKAIKALRVELPIEELQSLPQVLLCTKRILQGVRLTRLMQRHPQETQGLQKLETETLDLAERAALLLAKKQNITPFQVYLRMGKHYEFMFESAYIKFIQNPQFNILSSEELQFLTNFSWKKSNTEILFKLISLGFTPQNLTSDEKNYLLKKALDEYNDTVASTLIKNGFFCLSDKKKNSDLVFECISNGLTESTKALLEKGVDFSIKDENGLTPLHYYFLLGNIDLVRMIMKRVDPTIKNDNNETPLSCLLAPQTEIARTVKNMNPDVPEFILSLFSREKEAFSGVRERHDSYRRELKKFETSILIPACDTVELTFLLGDSELQKKLFLHVGREVFEKSCVELRKKYPREAVDTFFFSSFFMKESHFETGCDIITLPQGVDETNDISKLSTLCNDIYSISLSDLKRLTSSFSEKQISEFTAYFKKIQFHFSSSFSRDSLNELKEFSTEEQLKLFTAIKKYRRKTFSATEEKALEDYLHKVTYRKSFLGTPQEGSSGLDYFYRIIENNLKHIVFSLEQKRDAELTVGTLKEFIEASPKCGGRYFAVAQLQAEKVCLGLEPSPQKLFERSLGSLREMCLSGIIAERYRDQAHNVHAYNLALYHLGKSLGIPGHQHSFNDNVFTVPFDKDEVLSLFKKSYTIDTIVHGWVLPKLTDDIDFRNFYIDLQLALVPESWQLADQRKPIDREEIVSDFMTRIVYDERGKFSALGVFFLLERIEVVESMLPGRSSDQCSIYMS